MRWTYGDSDACGDVILRAGTHRVYDFDYARACPGRFTSHGKAPTPLCLYSKYGVSSTFLIVGDDESDGKYIREITSLSDPHVRRRRVTSWPQALGRNMNIVLGTQSVDRRHSGGRIA
jgi:hypothetical protein